MGGCGSGVEAGKDVGWAVVGFIRGARDLPSVEISVARKYGGGLWPSPGGGQSLRDDPRLMAEVSRAVRGLEDHLLRGVARLWQRLGSGWRGCRGLHREER